MEPDVGLLPFLDSPFPGLRAFDTEEAILFFGREAHTEALLQRLGDNRFLGVVGSSGCGKSSLVRAGLLPALLRGYLVGATSRWRLAVLRPGAAPIDALAAALAAKGALAPPADAAALRRTLGASSGGLIDAVRQAGLAAGESLLVVVDQFEEIFRMARPDDPESQAPLFIELLLRAVASDAPIYVALTMRTDYQGDCAQFPGLPEALNRSQYLVPRLTRDQRRQAIVKPLALAGIEATPRLVTRLLNDAGAHPDQLPVLQHALLRTYRHWQDAGGKGDLDLADYDAVDGIDGALNQHGDALLAGFSADDRQLTEKIFRCLTSTEKGRDGRRPTALSAIYGIVGATDEPAKRRVDNIVSTFAQREHSLLLHAADGVVDITHESLMRGWRALKGWVEEEARSADWYRDLARDTVRYRTKDVGLWRDPALAGLLRRREREGWNEAWVHQYRPGDPPYEEVERFLAESVEAQARERREEEEQRQRELKQAQALARARRRALISLTLLLVALVSAILVVYVQHRQNKSEREADLRTQQRKEAELAAKLDQQQAALQRKYLAASDSEKGQLLQQLLELQSQVTSSKTKAGDYERQLDDLKKNKIFATPDESARIRSLQDQLTTATGKSAQLAANLTVSQNQIDALTAERNKLLAERNKLSEPRKPPSASSPALRPVFQVLNHDYRIVHLTAAPFAGNVALGVADIHSKASQTIRVYVWTTGGGAPLPEEAYGEEAFQKALKKSGIKLPKDESCGADGPPGFFCYPIKGEKTIQGQQLPGSFLFEGNRYEIRATGWNSGYAYNPPRHEDSINFAIYPAAPPASGN